MSSIKNELDNDEQEAQGIKNKKPMKQTDLPDNEHDAERMKPEEAILDLPDVSEIPGQEHIHVPRIKEMEDVTIASDDEEGVGIFGEEEDEDEIDYDDTDISESEKGRLEKSVSDMPGDDERLRKTELDETDDDGDELNEGSMATDVSGADLDTLGTDEDDANESIGEEDEENNTYSLGGDNNENLEEDKS